MKTEPNLSGAREPNLSAAKQEPVLEQAKKLVLVKPEKPELVDIDLVTAYGAEGIIVSDIRLKRDISQVARLNNGVGLYRYRYRGSDQAYVGVMAQEVAEVVPDAVVRGPDGYLRVNYDRLGLSLVTWEEWVASTQPTAPLKNRIKASPPRHGWIATPSIA
jgi:hypothetical protein